jgi:hypothetical protein
MRRFHKALRAELDEEVSACTAEAGQSVNFGADPG